MTIKELREQTKLSQSKFAAYFGLSVRSLQDWEQGRKKTPEYLPGLIERIMDYEKELGINTSKAATGKKEGTW